MCFVEFSLTDPSSNKKTIGDDKDNAGISILNLHTKYSCVCLFMNHRKNSL